MYSLERSRGGHSVAMRVLLKLWFIFSKIASNALGARLKNLSNLLPSTFRNCTSEPCIRTFWNVDVHQGILLILSLLFLFFLQYSRTVRSVFFRDLLESSTNLYSSLLNIFPSNQARFSGRASNPILWVYLSYLYNVERWRGGHAVAIRVLLWVGLFVVSPHSKNSNNFLLLENLVDNSVLDIDSSRVTAFELTDERFIS